MKEIHKVKSELHMSFEMKDLGEANRLLGMDIMRDRRKGKLWLPQLDYV